MTYFRMGDFDDTPFDPSMNTSSTNDPATLTYEKMLETIRLAEAKVGPRVPIFESIRAKNEKILLDALERLTGQPVAKEPEVNILTAFEMWRVVVADYMPENIAVLVGRSDMAVLNLETGKVKTVEVPRLSFPRPFSGTV